MSKVGKRRWSYPLVEFVIVRMNLDKLAFLIKGTWEERNLLALKSFGIEVRDRVKYLGTIIGHAPSDEAYAPVLASTYVFVGHSAAKTAFTLPYWI